MTTGVKLAMVVEKKAKRYRYYGIVSVRMYCVPRAGLLGWYDRIAWVIWGKQIRIPRYESEPWSL